MLTIEPFCLFGIIGQRGHQWCVAQDDILGDLAEENLPTTTQAEDQQAADQATAVDAEGVGTTAEKISRVNRLKLKTQDQMRMQLPSHKIQQVTEKQETVPGATGRVRATECVEEFLNSGALGPT